MRTGIPLLLPLLFAAAGLSQDAVTIRVDAAATVGPFKPIYAYFGYDEPNYTYTQNGRKLVGELAAMSACARVHSHALHAGHRRWNAGVEVGVDKCLHGRRVGKAGLRLDDHGPHFRHVFAGGREAIRRDRLHAAGAFVASRSRISRPGFPAPRTAITPSDGPFRPKDYGKWGELVYQWVKHSVEKYGKDEVESWYWEVWNEPDISYWHGTPEEYDKLYDYAAAAVKRALPSARVGGPATTGPSGAKAAAFLRQFLEHCDHGSNSATGGTGAPLDFITYHAKGRPTVVDGHVRMGIAKHAEDVDNGICHRPRVSEVRGSADRAERV